MWYGHSLVSNLDSMQELMEAARRGNMGILKELIQQGATVNFTDEVWRVVENFGEKMDTCFKCQRSYHPTIF